MCHDVMQSYPPTPRAEVLQRVCNDLHPVAEHAVQIELFVLVYYRWQEEDQAPVGFQEVPRENDEVGREHGQLVWFGGGHVWLVIPSEVESEELRLNTGARMRTRAVVAIDMDQPHAPFYGQDALHLLGRRLRGYQTDRSCATSRLEDMRLQGGSVTMASKSPPHLQGFRVMSKVHKSRMRCRTPY